MDGNRHGKTGLEIRVHGIGNHDLLSALGSPKVIKDGKKREPTLVGAPTTAPHALRLLNWSRMSRSAPSWQWYLAFPFTLANLADAMAPTGSGIRRVCRAAVLVFTLALTATTTMWVLAMSERLVLLVDYRADMRPLVAVLTTWGMLSTLMLARGAKPESAAHLPMAVLHFAVMSATLAAVWWARPAQVEVPPDTGWALLASEGPTDETLQQWLEQGPPTTGDQQLWFDAIGFSAYGLIVAAIAVSTVLAVCGLLAARSHSSAPPFGAAMAVLFSASLLNMLASALLVGAGQLLIRWQDIPLPFGDRDPYDPSRNLVIGRFTESYATKLVPATALAGLLLLALVLAVTTRVTPLAFRRHAHPRKALGEWGHQTVAEIPQLLRRVVPISVLGILALLWLVAVASAGYYTSTHTLLAQGPVEWYGRAAVVASVLAGAILWSIRSVNVFAPLREGLALIADVAGFWPITVHPLGARTYRRQAVKGLHEALEKATGDTVVLVGHSQGSVLCAWLLARPEDAYQEEGPLTRAPYLVSCGSPLKSLYATFFPAYFAEAFFQAVRTNSRGWHNFWRETDPIAAEIGPAARDERLEDTPTANGDSAQLDARGHSDYWIDPRQVACVRVMLAGDWVEHEVTSPSK